MAATSAVPEIRLEFPHSNERTHINHPTWTASELPFGDVKRSGYRRELTGPGVEEFVNKKLIRVSALNDPL